MLQIAQGRPGMSAIVMSVVSVLLAASGVSAQPPADLHLNPVASLANTVALRSPGDGSQRLFAVVQSGRIHILDLRTNSLPPSPFLDISVLVDDTENEQGLLGLAFHPNFAQNGYFYVNYTRDPGAGLDRTRVARYTVSSADPQLADPTSGVIIIEIEQDFGNHNGGDMHFGPDGYLYIGMGDGGSARDPLNRAQDLGSLLGKILRIDVDAPPGSANCGLAANYGIPADNPFVGGAAACPEIWAFGVRNPWRFSFDRRTGDVWIGDVGQNQLEEIDFQPAASLGGENYGWSCKEGTNTPDFNSCLPGPLTEPVLTYSHSVGCSVTGGFRYRGCIQGLRGTYVYADFCSGRIWFATEDHPGEFSAREWDDTSFAITTFGEDESGELYLADRAGSILRFESPSTCLPSQIFTDGFESGNTSAWSRTGP